MNNKEKQRPTPPFAVGDCVVHCGRRVIVLRYQWEYSEGYRWSWHYACSGLPSSLVGASALTLARPVDAVAAPHFSYGDRVRYSCGESHKEAGVVRVYAYLDDGSYNSMTFPGWIYALDDGTEWPQAQLQHTTEKDAETFMTPTVKTYRQHTVTYDDGIQSLSVTIPKGKQDVRIYGRTGENIGQLPVALLRRVLAEIDEMP